MIPYLRFYLEYTIIYYRATPSRKKKRRGYERFPPAKPPVPLPRDRRGKRLKRTKEFIEQLPFILDSRKTGNTSTVCIAFEQNNKIRVSPRSISTRGNTRRRPVADSTPPLDDTAAEDDDQVEFVHHIISRSRGGIGSHHQNCGKVIDDGAEVVVVGEKEGIDPLKHYPHPRPLCSVFSFKEERRKFCNNRFCVRCQVRARSSAN